MKQRRKWILCAVRAWRRCGVIVAAFDAGRAHPLYHVRPRR